MTSEGRQTSPETDWKRKAILWKVEGSLRSEAVRLWNER